jgi:hypothetical protein
MNEAVSKVLAQLSSFPWFAKCGQPIEGDYLCVQSLKEAHKHYADPRGMGWENSKLSVFNRQASLVWDATHAIRAEQQANARATSLAVEHFLAEYRARIFATIPEDKYLSRMVRLDVGWIASEAEDRMMPDMVGLQFFSTILLPVYLAGHMPCGWSGKRIPSGWDGCSLEDLPAGQLIVF